MPKARKEHNCTLCHDAIEKCEKYVYHTITIWDHIENESFGVYKAHIKCDDVWNSGVGRDVDWCFPEDKYEWSEIQAGAAP